jgi:XTP/dITP diphosphohydrolase
VTDRDPLREFWEVMRRLRAECSWKAAQTHRSLVRYLVEETHETVEAIEHGTPDDLREELGDLLLQVYFHAAIAEESGEFTVDDVARDVAAKMRRRNPHVFGDARGGTPEEVNDAWQAIKAREKARGSVTEGLPSSLPALLWADKVLDRLERTGAPVTPAEPLVLLVPSPLLGPATWEPVARRLRDRGRPAEVVDLGEDLRTPAGVVGAVERAAGDRPVVLVPHSNAGLYVPLLRTRLDLRAVVLVDAALPGPGAATPLAPPALLDLVRPLADEEDRLPPWTEWWSADDRAALFPDLATAQRVEREAPRVPLAYLDDSVATPAGWEDGPGAYVAFGDTYAEERSHAEALGWPTARLPSGHLHQLLDPVGVADVLDSLVDRLLPDALGAALLTLVARAHRRGGDPEQALRDTVRGLLPPDPA